MASDPLQIILDLLSNNWNSANTNSIKPEFSKITDIKRIEYNLNQDWILVHRNFPLQEPAGIGVALKRTTQSFNVDIRVLGAGQEQHFLEVIEEVERILDSKIRIPDSNYQILDPDGQRQDLSDKSFAMWRLLMPVKLKNYNVSRS